MELNNKDTAKISITLVEPSPALSLQVTSKVQWSDRIVGVVSHPGPGDSFQRLGKLEEVYNLLVGMDNFRLDFGQLRDWISNKLGDYELAKAIDIVLGADETQDTPAQIVELIATRLNQCHTVLDSLVSTNEEGSEIIAETVS